MSIPRLTTLKNNLERLNQTLQPFGNSINFLTNLIPVKAFDLSTSNTGTVAFGSVVTTILTLDLGSVTAGQRIFVYSRSAVGLPTTATWMRYGVASSGTTVGVFFGSGSGKALQDIRLIPAALLGTATNNQYSLNGLLTVVANGTLSVTVEHTLDTAGGVISASGRVNLQAIGFNLGV